MKLGRDKVRMVPHLCVGYTARYTQGLIQRVVKIDHGGAPSPKASFFRLDGYNNKPNVQQCSYGIRKEVLLFCVPFLSKIFDMF